MRIRLLRRDKVVFVKAADACAMEWKLMKEVELGYELLFVLVDGGDTVGAWAMPVIAIIGWVDVRMEVVGEEHDGHTHDGLTTLGRCLNNSCVRDRDTVDK